MRGHSKVAIVHISSFLLAIPLLQGHICSQFSEGPCQRRHETSLCPTDTKLRLTERLRGGGNLTSAALQGKGKVSITRVSSVGSLNAHYHDEDLGFSLFLERRCKWVWFVRHAEGFHNVAERQHELGTLYLQEEHSGWRFWDSALTARGKEQCQKTLREVESLSHSLELELIVVSPLTRTLQTADLTVGKASPRHWSGERPPMIASDLCRERITNCPADSRRPLGSLMKEFPHIDFSELTTEYDEMWELKEDNAKCKERGLKFLRWLEMRPERSIAVVTHSGFLKRLFEQFGMGTAESDLEELHRRPANCEMRGVVLCSHRHFNDQTVQGVYDATFSRTSHVTRADIPPYADMTLQPLAFS